MAEGGWSGTNMHTTLSTSMKTLDPHTTIDQLADYNILSQAISILSGSASADAIPIADPCFKECYLDIYLHLNGNTGAAALRYGIPISVYSRTGTDLTLLGTYLRRNP